MVRKVCFHVVFGLVVFCCLAASCKHKTGSPEAEAEGVLPVFAVKGAELLTDTLPGRLDSTDAGFRDLHSYASDGYFHIVGMVDNNTVVWQKFWLQAELLDGNGNVLKFRGKSNVRFRSYSEAVPPRGATAFYLALPMKEISGTPADCRMTVLGAQTVGAGAILIASPTGGVRMQRPDPSDSSRMQEVSIRIQGYLENPLTLDARRPRIVLLLYGKDQKLYYAHHLDPELEDTPLDMEPKGPMTPAEKRFFFAPVQYIDLPTEFQKQLIERVDAQAYDAR